MSYSIAVHTLKKSEKAGDKNSRNLLVTSSDEVLCSVCDTFIEVATHIH